MTAAYIQPGPVAHMRYDARHRKPNKGVTIAIAVTALVHGAIFAALVTARFTPILQNYVDDKTDVLLTHTPEAPPPPPVKAPPVKEHTAPPVVQPRPPANIDSSFAAPPPLYIAPVETPRPQVAGPPVAAAAPAPVSAPAPARPTIIANPDWVGRPTADEVAKYYPERALRMSISGRATLLCKVTAKGAVEQCAITSESPADQGFGAASLRVAHYFVMRPQIRDGQPVDGAQVIIPMRFTPPEV